MRVAFACITALACASIASGEPRKQSVYFGGDGYEAATAIAFDAEGNTILAGMTTSSAFPLTVDTNGRVQPVSGGETDIFVAKLSADGRSVLWATFLGGRGTETLNDMALDREGNIYLSGDTTSVNFPVYLGLQKQYGGGFDDAFVAKLNRDGRFLHWSTYIGGSSSDYGNGLALDAGGNVYLTGWTASWDFPVRNALQPGPSGGGADGFLLKLGTSRGELVFSTYLGSGGQDFGTGVAVDASGDVYVTGSTSSSLFSLARPFQSSVTGGLDAFLLRFSPDARVLKFGSFLGGSGDDIAYRVVAAEQGKAWVTGYTLSADFPVFSTTAPSRGGGSDVFIAAVSTAEGKLEWTRRMAGSGEDASTGKPVLDGAALWVTGWTSSPDFPAESGVRSGKTDGFVAALSPDTGALLGTTLVGGSGDDNIRTLAIRPGLIRVAGRTSSPDLPAPQGALRVANGYPGEPFDAFTMDVALGTANRQLTVQPSALSVALLQGQRSEALRVVVTSAAVPVAVGVAVEAGEVTPWLRASASGNVITAELDASSLPPGVHTGVLLISAAGFANSPFRVLVELRVQPPAPQTPLLTAAGVVSAASSLPGAVSPGELITVYVQRWSPTQLTAASPFAGIWPEHILDARLLFNGVPAPLMYAAPPGQIGAAVPFSVAGAESVELVLETSESRSNPVRLPVVPARPALFTSAQSGAGQAAALNEDGSYNSPANPAIRGEVVVLFATGLGLHSRAVASGGTAPLADPPGYMTPIWVTVAGKRADVLYAGAAPGQIFGLAQINVRVAEDTPAGTALPVIVSAGGALSRDDVTIAVR